MNRHQREVADMDRRHFLVVRALSFLGAAVLIVAALWSAGLPPAVWWERVHAWWATPSLHTSPRFRPHFHVDDTLPKNNGYCQVSHLSVLPD